MVRRTKIVATVGPASSETNMIKKLIDAGVNIFRLNFSHGDHQQHRANAENIRQIAADMGCIVGILGDLQGPKIRIGDLPEPRLLIDGEQVTLTITKDTHDERVNVSFQPLPNCVQAGDTLLLDDGLIRLIVQSATATDVICEIEQGGLLKSRKGLNRLGGGLSAPAITEKDHRDIELAAELNLDYLAVSFPSCAADLDPVREQLTKLNRDIALIAKVERAEAVATDETLQALILASDGVMVARGDLGVEIGDAQLIGVQKKIISMARRANRPVITATQMMESMIEAPVPTRAEVFDVANAVLDGTDAVMLSAETAAGKHPDKVVAAMANACLGAEQHPSTRTSRHRLDKQFQSVGETIALSAIYASNHLDNIVATVCLTESGKTALLASRLSSGLPIYALSRHPQTRHRMALYRGVIPLAHDVTYYPGDSYEGALTTVAGAGNLQPGQQVTITCGDIPGSPGLTNTLKILTYNG